MNQNNMTNEASEEHSVQTPQDQEEEDTRKRLEHAHNGKLMRVEDLPAEYIDLIMWVARMKFGRDRVLAVLRDNQVTLKWYTQDSVISISARLSLNDAGYLGGTASHRASRPGETWTRGNDLADGPYCEKTWNAIMADVVGWSALPLGITLPYK